MNVADGLAVTGAIPVVALVIFFFMWAAAPYKSRAESLAAQRAFIALGVSVLYFVGLTWFSIATGIYVGGGR